MMTRAHALSALVVWGAAVVAAGRGDYCREHLVETNSTYMQYNKELVEAEYAVHNQFKAIHCCAKGYRSIEWFKDGAAYPWASSVSNLILYPEAANQTLYTQRAGRPDAGNYTCRMRNDTHLFEHTIALVVSEMSRNTPQATVIPNDQTAEIGSDVRFYCEAFVGQVNLPDAHTDIKWRRVRPDEEFNFEGTGRAHSRHVSGDKDEPERGDSLAANTREVQTERESEDIVGAYLYISRVSPADYGRYVCTVRSNDVVSEMPVTLHFSEGSAEDAGPRALPWRGAVLCGVLVAVALLSLVALHARCWPRLALAARSLRDEPPVSDKEYDVVVACARVDAELTRGALLRTLVLRHHYRAAHLELPTSPDTWYELLSAQLSSCRAVVCVLSPAQYSPAQLVVALKQLRALPTPPIVVLLQELPKVKREAKDERGDCLSSLARRTRLLAWRHVQDRAFWTSLRLALPLPARPAAPAAASATNNLVGVDMPELSGGRRARRSDSVDALV